MHTVGPEGGGREFASNRCCGAEQYGASNTNTASSRVIERQSDVQHVV